MANRFIVVYRDGAGNLQLFPKTLTVKYHDTVTWVSNVNEDYVVQNFTPDSPPEPLLFPQPSYPVPEEGHSIPAVVVANIGVDSPPATYNYTCGDNLSAAMADAGSASGIIIVDPTGPGEPKENEGTQKAVQRSSSKRQQEKEPAVANGSRR